MQIHEAVFIGSYPSFELCPKDDKPEYAFIGRSNVGKSSLINMLCDRKGLAKTSNKPGKTQQLNYFLINQTWYLVDLPGYGYAIISKKMRQQWRRMIENYLIKRPNLQCAFVLVDANISPQQNDIEFINWLGKMVVPYVIVFTKTDRSKPLEIEENINKFRKALLEHWEELPTQFITSSNKGVGKTELLTFITQANEQILTNNTK
jgi:GTP-binding protein